MLSPVREAGAYDRADRFAPLRTQEPMAIIGRCFLVYDLDQIAGWKEYVEAKFPQSVSPATRDVGDTSAAMAAETVRRYRLNLIRFIGRSEEYRLEQSAGTN